ncbi:MAG TPA: ATP-binding protein [Nitrospira sp.]|nr:ATP-binding protein [Nitrospira sp.]
MANSNVGFQFKARVLLELGAELISSDSIAVYELVKNSLDAGSKEVHIHIDVPLQHSAYRQLRGLLEAVVDGSDHENEGTVNLEVFNQTLRQEVEDSGASEEVRVNFFRHYGKPLTHLSALDCLDEAYLRSNRICFKDIGCGMSAENLKEVYMTVGTSNRRTEKDKFVKTALGGRSRLHYDYAQPAKGIPLGEKGIGRLAAMRLGHYIKVTTKTVGEEHWNVLHLDWRKALSDADLDPSDLNFELEAIPAESDEVTKSGTSIEVFALQGDWSSTKVGNIARHELAKLADPFANFAANKFIHVRFQDALVRVPILDQEPLEAADAVCEARLVYDDQDQPNLRVSVDYKRLGSQSTDVLKSDHLWACVREEPTRKAKKAVLVDADIVGAALRRIGPWEMKFYWFNRGRILRNQPAIWESSVKDFLQTWGGGFLVYRDGFRVYPYGERSDDWLDLDRKALSASSFKLNRAQMVGYLRISSIANPMLEDQTNREGFRDSYEKEALRRLLRWVILAYCRPFLEEVERKKEPPIDEVVTEVEKRITTSKDAAIGSLKAMSSRVPSETASIKKVMAHLEDVSEAWERAKLRIESFEDEIERFIHLAGVGLMLEFIAHELSRITQDTLKAVSARRFSPQVIEAQLKTLDKRVRILDELSVPGRQRRKEENLGDLVNMLVEFHADKATRDQINIRVIKEGKGAFREVVEKGQILQILDNLLSNSFYWLRNRLDVREHAEVTIVLDSTRREIRFTDNGPGIPTERAEQVFEQFFTTKPPQAGRGLGLYIAKRLAQENNATLTLAPVDEGGVHRTFVLKYGAVE